MIILKSDREIKIMREGGKILGNLMKEFEYLIKPGITTIELDKFAENYIIKNGGSPAFKGYVPHFKKYYYWTICTSVNESVVHEIPSNRVLKEGDIISIDVGIYYKNYYTDTAYTYPVGNISEENKKLLEVTKKALDIGISKAKVGNRISDISHSIQSYVEQNGFNVIREFTGHGIGKELHEEPIIFNFGPPSKGERIKPGMTFAIEPMVSIGDYRIEIAPDGWTAMTKDRSNSAHFEHTIAITETNPIILTLP